jgi:hypothetical protein
VVNHNSYPATPSALAVYHRRRTDGDLGRSRPVGEATDAGACQPKGWNGISHARVITKIVSKGNVCITQHSTQRYDCPLKKQFATNPTHPYGSPRSSRPTRTRDMTEGSNSMPNRSGARTVLLWETGVVLAAMCCWLVLATIYDNEAWAVLLDGPKLPLAAGLLVAVSLAAGRLLWRSGHRTLRAVGYAVTVLRLTGVLMACLLIAQELYDYTTNW